MRYLYLLLLASLGANAAETYVLRGDLRSAMDAHARAGNDADSKAVMGLLEKL